MDPKAHSPISSASGLFQILKKTLDDYNKIHKRSLAPDTLFNPAINATVAVDLLQKIIAEYFKHPSLKVDWNDPRTTSLVALGWNAGWSEADGVAGVVSKMEKAGITPNRVTIVSVGEAAHAAGSPFNKYLPQKTRQDFAAKVIRYYMAWRGGWKGEGPAPELPPALAITTTTSQGGLLKFGEEHLVLIPLGLIVAALISAGARR
jgi:hypothetical protein